MSYFRKFFGHLFMIFKHKTWVFYYACKLGIPFRGLVHDLSKFSPTEFFESVRYYTGTSSPIPECKKANGYSLAWQHHKGRNPHHYEYWMDNFDKGGTPIRMPFIYSVEMICDWLAAGKAYRGKDFNYEDELKWWEKKRLEVTKSMHPATIIFCNTVFERLAKGYPVTKELMHVWYDSSYLEWKFVTENKTIDYEKDR